jgi:hypothetical protein
LHSNAKSHSAQAEGSIGWHDKEGESRTASSPWGRWCNANGHGGCHLDFPHIRAIKFFPVLSPLHILSICNIILDGDGFVQAVGQWSRSVVWLQQFGALYKM